ncbi:MAG TPA: hypothetical protein VFE46_19505 [Pirellulales bacterium]|jgi:hypothetical protein|nr:hypothetical protein [Pirellulales bacterium]
MADNEADFDDSSSASTGSVDQAEFVGRSRFVLAALLALAAPFLVDAAPIAGLKTLHGDELILTPLLFSIIFAKYGLMAMWLAWGGSRAIWRMIILAISWFFTCMLTPGPYTDVPQLFLAFYLQLIVIAAAIAVPRLFGVRWVADVKWSAGVSVAQNKPYQFSIYDLLIWTTTVAILAELIRWVGMPQGVGMEGIFFMSLGGAMLAFIVLTAMWAQLAEMAVGSSMGGRTILTFILALIMAVVVVSLSRAPGKAAAFLFMLILATTGWLLAACYVLRCYGHRLVRRKSSSPQATIT